MTKSGSSVLKPWNDWEIDKDKKGDCKDSQQVYEVTDPAGDEVGGHAASSGEDVPARQLYFAIKIKGSDKWSVTPKSETSSCCRQSNKDTAHCHYPAGSAGGW